MLRNATLRQLSAFHAVARTGSVSRAASELYLTQPAVSIQLKLLEESAGTPLLQREGRGVRLTQAGDLMASYAGRILDLWRDVGDEMATLRGVFSGTLRVGAVTTAEYLLPPLLVSFANEHPNVKVKLRVGNRDDIARMLAAQEVDLVIMGRPPCELKTVSTAFAKHPMAFIASPRHPLMAQRDVSLADVSGANLLARERGSGTRTTLERLFKDEAIVLRIGSELSSNEAIKADVRRGLRRSLPVVAHLPARTRRWPAATAAAGQQPGRARVVRDAPGVAATAAGGGGVRAIPDRARAAAHSRPVAENGRVDDPSSGPPVAQALSWLASN